MNAITGAGYTVGGDIDLSGVSPERGKWDWKPTTNKYTAKGNTKISVTFKKANQSAGQVTTQNGASATTQAQTNANSAVANLNPTIDRVTVTKKEATNVKTTPVSTKYAYNTTNYTGKKTDSGENVVISTTTYDAAKVEHEIGYYDNKNYYNGKNLLVESTDEAFNKFLQEHKDEVNRQASIKTQAEEAVAAYAAAKAEVQRLEGVIASLQAQAIADDAVAAADQEKLEKQLEDAKKDMEAAEKAMKAISGQITALGDDLVKKTAELTPAPVVDTEKKTEETKTEEIKKEETKTEETKTAVVPTYDNVISPSAPVSKPVERTTESVPTVAPTTTAPVASEANQATETETAQTTTPVATAVAGVVTTPVVANVGVANAAAANLVAVNPVAAPLAQLTLDGADADADAEADAEDEEVTLQPLVEANDVEAARADITLDSKENEAKSIFGMWWLLLVAILGGTGYTMYRKFHQNKATEKVDENK